MTDEAQAEGPGTVNELQRRQFVEQTIKEQQEASTKAKEHEDKMMSLIAAIDKGVMNTEEIESRFKSYDDKIATLEMKLLKTKAQGMATISKEAPREDEAEKLRKLYPGLAAKGLL